MSYQIIHARLNSVTDEIEFERALDAAEKDGKTLEHVEVYRTSAAGNAITMMFALLHKRKTGDGR